MGVDGVCKKNRGIKTDIPFFVLGKWANGLVPFTKIKKTGEEVVLRGKTVRIHFETCEV